jgi:hypothetical protein
MAGRAMTEDLLTKVQNLLMLEGGLIETLARSKEAKNLSAMRGKLLARIKEIGKRKDLSLIVATEKVIVEDELRNHANSKGMVSSLNAALTELAAIEKLLAIVDDEHEYRRVDQSHILPRNREKGLPLDEARQAFKSHYARLSNLDKARLSEDEKAIIEARRDNMLEAGKIYAQRQARTLDVSED